MGVWKCDGERKSVIVSRMATQLDQGPWDWDREYRTGHNVIETRLEQ